MSQISPPIRILIIAAVGLMAVWMLVLRPKTAEEPVVATPAPNVQTDAPAVSKPGKAVEAAQAAADATNAKLKAEEDGTGTAAAGTKAAPATKPSGTQAAAATADRVDLKNVPAPVAKAIRKDKTLVLLFWNRDSSDDRAVRRELRKIDRWDGRVYVQAASVKSVSKYGKITRGADVSQSPTTLVIGRDLKVTPLVGYVDSKTIDQAVLDSIRNSGGYLKDPYLAKVNEVCAGSARAVFQVPDPSNFGEVGSFYSSQKHVYRRLDSRIAAIKAPSKWRAFKRATVADTKMLAAYLADVSAYLGTSPSRTRVISAAQRFDARTTAAVARAKRFTKRMDAEHLLNCGTNS